jgi:hypothetical protein
VTWVGAWAQRFCAYRHAEEELHEHLEQLQLHHQHIHRQLHLHLQKDQRSPALSGGAKPPPTAAAVLRYHAPATLLACFACGVVSWCTPALERGTDAIYASMCVSLGRRRQLARTGGGVQKLGCNI